MHKTLSNVEVKDAAKGEVSAVFATLNVVDKDGDVTVKGAFKDGAPCVISDWNHTSWEGARPVGKGVIREVGNEAVFEGRFFMNTTHGRDAFETVKGMSEGDGPGCEWSYGFDVEDSEIPTQKMADNHRRTLKRMKVHEVSPVMQGAGVGTRVLGVKSDNNKTFVDELTEVVASVKAVRERAADVMAKRAEKGKGLGEESLAQVKALGEAIGALQGELDTMLAGTKSTDEVDVKANDELRAAYLRFIRDNT